MGGPSPVICKFALAVELDPAPSANNEMEPGPQDVSTTNEKVAFPLASVDIEELPLIELAPGYHVSERHEWKVKNGSVSHPPCCQVRRRWTESVRVGYTFVPPVLL